MNLNNELILIISSCESYSDLWENHMKLLNQNWAERNIDTVIVTDKHHDGKVENAKIFCAGDSLEMPQRIKEYLKHVKTEYVLLTLDDYYVKKKINNKKIVRAVELMKRYSLDYLRFWKYPHERTKILGVKNVRKIELLGNYKVNLYPAIWRKTFLEQTIQNSLSAWEYEVSLTQIARSLNAKCAYSTNGEFPIVDVIRKGKLLHPAKHFLKARGMTLDRELISWRQEIKLGFLYYVKEIVPKPILRVLKKILVKRGHKFISKGV